MLSGRMRGILPAKRAARLDAAVPQARRLADDIVVASTSVLSATPAFVAGLILVFFFAVELGWLPVLEHLPWQSTRRTPPVAGW